MRNSSFFILHSSFNRVFIYFATLSSHLTIESITIIEAPVAPTKTNQQAQIGTVV